jgi:hypothetical protein
MSIDWDREPDLHALRRAVDGLSHNVRQAVSDLEELVERGSAMSMYYLGVVYQRGDKIERDYAKAGYWYRRLSDWGSVLGLYYLGRLHKREGRHREALLELGDARLKDFGPALNSLGSMYFHGEGVARDRMRAKELWARAVAQGHILAKRNLGRYSILGAFGPKNILPGFGLFFSGFADRLRERDEASDRLR